MRRRLMPSLTAITAFEAAARHGSIARSATELHLSQSAVSRLVRQVEDALQVPLFDRSHQRLTLTGAGVEYAQSVRAILDDLEQATFRAMAHGNAAGSLSLGVFSTLGTKWLIPRLPGFQKSRPGVIVSCFVRPEPFDFDLDRLDAAIHYGEPVWPHASSVRLFGETLVPVASPHLDGLRDARTPADLIRLPLLHEATRPSVWAEWHDAQGLEQRNAFQGARFDQFGAVMGAAVAGLGIGLVPLILARDEIAAKRLVVPLDLPLKGAHSYHLVIPQRNAGMRLLEEFRDWLLEECRQEADLN
jgi:LysR family glycine cleavage system transcriptional activator